MPTLHDAASALRAEADHHLAALDLRAARACEARARELEAEDSIPDDLDDCPDFAALRES